MNESKLVAAYCRVSTLEQKRKGYGIDIQTRDVRRFAQREGLVVDRFYKDEAESGVAAERKHLRRLLRDCKAGRIATIIIPSLDRLSRRVRLAENLFYEFEQSGIRVLIADMPNYNGDDRKEVLVRQIREAIAEENRKDIIERLWKGRQERVRRGLPPGGTPPYGYRRRGKRLVANPGEVEIVRSIFDLAENQRRCPEIAHELSERGLLRRNGKPWTRRQVACVLSRRKLYSEGLLRYGSAEGQNKTLVLVHEEPAPKHVLG